MGGAELSGDRGQDEEYLIDTIVGPRKFTRKVGDVLDPTRDTLEQRMELKAQMGEYLFMAQFQQNPLPAGGFIVKKDWLKYYESTAALPTSLPKFRVGIQRTRAAS